METKERSEQWVLELGMRVCGGARPWRLPLVLGTIGLISWLVFSQLTSTGFWADPAQTTHLEELAAQLVVVTMCAPLVVLLAYRATARRAHRTWHTLTDEERREMLAEYSERLGRALEELDPRATTLDLAAGDLEGLSPTHRQQLQSLVDAAAAVGKDGFCATVRHDARVLLEAARVHRELSLDTIVRAETAVPLVLVELDGEIAKTTDELRNAVETGECVCSRPQASNRLTDVCLRAREQADLRRGR